MQSKILLIVILIALISCSEYERMLKSSDYDAKYEYAKNLYDNKKYAKALPLFEELLPITKLTERGEMVYYYFAYSYYAVGDYTMSSYYFKRFAKTYPNSIHAEECEFLSAYSKVLNSPKPSLDQSETYAAIFDLQLFLKKYPNTSRRDECNKIMDELRGKLEKKDFDNAKLLFKMNEHKGAVVAFNNVLKDFPETKHKEEITFLILKSQFLLAENSVLTKKSERYEETMNTYIKFVDEFGEKSSYMKEAEGIYNASSNKLNALKDK